MPGTFTYTPEAGTVLGLGNNQNLSASFAPANTTNYEIAAGTASISVLLAPAITWTSPPGIVYGTPLVT